MASIRLATPADLPLLARLAGHGVPWINTIRTPLTRSQLDVWLAIQAAEPVGYTIIQSRHVMARSLVKQWLGRLAVWRRHRIVADPAHLLQPMRIATVREVFVQPECRRSGIGTELISYGIEHVRTHGFHDIRVQLTAAGTRLKSFYERLGFAPIQVYLTVSLTADAFPPHATEMSRPATHRDAEPLAILVRDAVHYQQALTSAFQLRTDIDWRAHTAAKLSHRDIHLQVIELDHRIGAFIELRLVPYGVVQDIYVSPSQRRRGLATRLLQDAHRWFKAQGVAKVRAAIWHDNHSSLRLFQDAGYEIDETVLRLHV